jgi:adenylylsulfate kinase-like enzyme
MVIWVTGLSASGKSTLCQALYRLMKPRLPSLTMLDGDAVRAVMGHDLGHTEIHRRVQLSRLQHLAKLLVDQELCVLVAVLYSHPEALAWNRTNLPGYFEVYLKASLETVMARDPRGLYEKAVRGLMPDVVGIDIPWHEPRDPDVVFDMDNAPAPDTMAVEVASAVPRLRQILDRERESQIAVGS